MGKSKEVSRVGVVLLGIGLIILVAGLVLMIILFLPQQVPIRYQQAQLTITVKNQILYISQEQRMAILVILSGALGSTVHAATSFSKYLGWRQLYVSWVWWYLMRPFIGGMLALIVYFAIRGGLLVNDSGAESLNLFGVIALASLSGMFSRHAIDKLGVIFTKLFSVAHSTENQNKS